MIGSEPIMSNQSPPPGISEEDWSATPVAVRVLVTELLRRVAQLEARLNQTSRNSSNPPSSDPPSARPRPVKEPTGRKSGGQPGHEGHGRKLKPESEVDQLIDVRPESCEQCGALLLGDDEAPERHQVTELPRITPMVTEYRRHRLYCVACGVSTQAPWPATMPSGSFGPRVQATVGYLTGRLGASQREVQDLLATVCHTDVSVGSVGALEQAVSAALTTPVAEAEKYVQRQPVRNADETSWPEKSKRRWLWISVTPLVTIFRLLKTRGAVGAKELLGEVVWGIIGTDRYAAYNWIDPRQRQLCWAHLKREFIAWSERTGATARIGVGVISGGETALHVVVSGAGWHAGVGRLSSGDAAAHGAGADALTGRGGGGGHENARDVSQSAQTRSGLVDVCVGAGSRTHQQLRGAAITKSGIVAPAQLWHPECGGQSVCRTDLNGGDHLTPTTSRCVGLLDDRLHRSNL